MEFEHAANLDDLDGLLGLWDLGRHGGSCLVGVEPCLNLFFNLLEHCG
jgi:hypothetical protein